MRKWLKLETDVHDLKVVSDNVTEVMFAREFINDLSCDRVQIAFRYIVDSVNLEVIRKPDTDVAVSIKKSGEISYELLNGEIAKDYYEAIQRNIDGVDTLNGEEQSKLLSVILTV